MSVVRHALLAVVFVCLASWLADGQIVTSPVPYTKIQYFDNNGNPLAGGKLYSYAAGTTNPQPTYTDSTGSVPNSNPAILDASGRAAIWIGTTPYKLVLKDKNDVTIWTQDNVTDKSDILAIALGSTTGASMIGYQLQATGTVARTVADVLGEVVNVEDFGAFCLGGDDAPHIQAAIEYCATGATNSADHGCTVHISGDPVGGIQRRCHIGSTLNLHSRVRLSGDGAGKTHLQALPSLAGHPMIYIGTSGDGSNVAMSGVNGLNIDCSGPTSADSYCSTGITQVTGQENTVNYDLQIVHAGQYGISYPGGPFGSSNQNGGPDHHIWVFAPETSTSGCANLDGYFRGLEHWTCIGSNANKATPGATAGLTMTRGTTLNDIHFESWDTGLHMIGAGVVDVNLNGLGFQASTMTRGVLIDNASVGTMIATNIGQGGGDPSVWPLVTDNGCGNTITGMLLMRYEIDSACAYTLSSNGTITNHLGKTNFLGTLWSQQLTLFGDNAGSPGASMSNSGPAQRNYFDHGQYSFLLGDLRGPNYNTDAQGGLGLRGNGCSTSPTPYDPQIGFITFGAWTDGCTVQNSIMGTAQTIAGGPDGLHFYSNAAALGNFTLNEVFHLTPTGIITPTLHSASGTRFLCVDSSGNVTASASACSGT